MADLKLFWEKWAETTAVKLRWMSRRRLLMYYDHFANARHSIHNHPNEERAVLERMESIQRVLDRKSQFWATIIGLVAAIGTAASAGVGIAEYLARKHQPKPENPTSIVEQATKTPAQAQQAITPLPTPATPIPSSTVSQSPQPQASPKP